MRSFPGPRCLATVLALLEIGGRYETFELVHCCHAEGFPCPGSTYDRILVNGLCDIHINMILPLEITQFRESQECLNFSYDLDRCVP